MEPIVLRRPLMARGRRSEKGDCRLVTITLLFAALLGAVIFVSYPGPGKSAPGAGLLANLQGQAATLLGSQPKDVTEALSAEPERPKEISIEQASVTLQGPRSTLAAKQFRSEAKPKEEGRVENDLESTLRDAVDVRTIGADSSGAGSVRIEDATRNGDPVSAWASEEQRTDLEDESAGSGLPRKPVKSVRVEDLDLDWIPGGNEHVKDKTIGVREGRLSDAGSSKAEPVTDLVRAKAAALGDKEGDDDHREASVRSKSGLLLKRGEGVTSKESGSQNLARQWGAETLDKMVLARGESEGDTRGESFREGREEPWKSLTGAGLVKGLANGTVNGTGFATRLANALGLAGELLSATADLDTLAKMTAEAIKVLSNGTSHAESVTGAAGFNKSLANATGLLETVLGNDTQASAFVEKLAGLGLTRREVEAVWARNGSAALEGTGTPNANVSCTGSTCAAVSALKALFPEALNTRTLYIGPDPCPLIQLLNGSALIGLEPVWNTSADSHPSKSAYSRQSCGDFVTLRTLPHELRNTVAGAGSTIGFDLVVVAETFEKLDEREARKLIAAVAGVAKGPVIVAVGSVKQGNVRRSGEPERKRGLGTYEKDTWWLEAFAAEGLVEARAKSPLLEEARGSLPGGALLHLVLARGGNITGKSADEVVSDLPLHRLQVNSTSHGNTHPEPSDDDLLTVDTLDENAPWTRTAREGTERKRNGNGRDGTETEGGKRRDKPARQDVSHEAGSLLFSWLSSGFGAEAPKAADQGSPGERVSLRGGGSGGVVPDALAPRGEVPGAKKAGGRQKPALGLASRVREVVQEEEGGRLQEVLEKEALAAELEPGKDRVDLVTLAGSETESGVTSMDTAEDRKALNKRMPELVKSTTSWGASVKEVRRELEGERRRLRYI